MEPLVIEYVFDGHRRGYNFTSPTRHLDEATLKTIWRGAMPRGQGWGADAYLGARSLKCFPVDSRRVALSEVTVTDLQDEGGRRGIRRAVVELLTPEDCLARLKERLAAYPADVLARVEGKPSLGQWLHILYEALPRLSREAQVILTRDFTGMRDWQAVEALMIKAILAPLSPLQRWGWLPGFTTLALDYRGESPFVAVPAGRIARDEVSVIPLVG